MQRISFDFMTRKIRQVMRERSSKRVARKEYEAMTLELVMKNKERKEWERQFVPKTQRGSFGYGAASASSSRQVKRAVARRDAFNMMTKNYGGEVRKVRRSMAFAWLKNMRSASL
jgi:hypothetical protein